MCSLLLDEDLDTAVLRTAFLGLVGSCRLVEGHCLGGDLLGRYSALDQVLGYTLGTPLGQALVVGVGTDVVGVTVDDDHILAHLLDGLGIPADSLLVSLGEGIDIEPQRQVRVPVRVPVQVPVRERARDQR